MTVYDVVKKLVGPISPIGESNVDDERFENLKTMTDLVGRLLEDIDDVATFETGRQEYSRKRAGEYADKFLTRIGII